MQSDKQKCSHDLNHKERALWNSPRTWMAVWISRWNVSAPWVYVPDICWARVTCLACQGGVGLLLPAESSGTRLLNSSWTAQKYTLYCPVCLAPFKNRPSENRVTLPTCSSSSTSWTATADHWGPVGVWRWSAEGFAGCSSPCSQFNPAVPCRALSRVQCCVLTPKKRCFRKGIDAQFMSYSTFFTGLQRSCKWRG